MTLADKEIQQMEFRRKKTEEKIRELENLLDGRQRGFLKQIQDISGNFSEEKLKTFIQDLLDSLERYIRYQRETSDYLLVGQEREFYHSFIYCTIRGIAKNAYGPTLWAIPCKTYEDILNMASDPETMRIHNPEELYYEEIYEPVTGGFFGYMDEVYQLLTGEDISGTITEEQRAKVYEVYPQAKQLDKERKDIEAFEKSISEEEYQQAVDEWNEGGQTAEEEEMDDFLREIDEGREKWAREFVGTESFCKYYKTYRETYFAVDRRNFTSNIEGMIDVYLMEQGLSCYGDNNRFLRAYTLVDQAYIRTKSMMRRRG